MIETQDSPLPCRQFSLRDALILITLIGVSLAFLRSIPASKRLIPIDVVLSWAFSAFWIWFMLKMAGGRGVQSRMVAAWIGTVGGGMAFVDLMLGWYIGQENPYPPNIMEFALLLVVGAMIGFCIACGTSLTGIMAASVLVAFRRSQPAWITGLICGVVTGFAGASATCFLTFSTPYFQVSLFAAFVCGTISTYATLRHENQTLRRCPAIQDEGRPSTHDESA